MRTLIVVIIVVVAIMAAGKVFHHAPRDIQVVGDNVMINFGRVKITAKAMPESRYTFIINSGSPSEFNDGIFAAWTKEQADSLKAAYGDFTHCNSPGMQAGMSSLNTVFVFAADESIRAKIKHLIKISMHGPVVKFSASQLNIKAQTYNNTAVTRVEASGKDMYYLVRDVAILKENYNK